MSLVAAALPVFEHRLAGYRRVWRGSVFSTFLLPVLFLLGMGISVGAYVDTSGALGVPYIDYIAPGLLASAALQVAISETTWPILGAFNWIRTYHAMRASPLRPRDCRWRAALRGAARRLVGGRLPRGDDPVRHGALVVGADRGPDRAAAGHGGRDPGARVRRVHQDGQLVRDPATGSR